MLLEYDALALLGRRRTVGADRPGLSRRSPKVLIRSNKV